MNLDHSRQSRSLDRSRSPSHRRRARAWHGLMGRSRAFLKMWDRDPGNQLFVRLAAIHALPGWSHRSEHRVTVWTMHSGSWTSLRQQVCEHALWRKWSRAHVAICACKVQLELLSKLEPNVQARGISFSRLAVTFLLRSLLVVTWKSLRSYRFAAFGSGWNGAAWKDRHTPASVRASPSKPEPLSGREQQQEGIIISSFVCDGRRTASAAVLLVEQGKIALHTHSRSLRCLTRLCATMPVIVCSRLKQVATDRRWLRHRFVLSKSRRHVWGRWRLLISLRVG